MVVTINPEDRGRAAKTLAITEVRLHKSGQIIDARQFIERLSYGLLIRIRGLLQEARHRKKIRISCAFCGRAVYLVAMTQKDFFFRHGIEDGLCPAITRSKMTAEEINARKYLGARESPAHIQTKEFLERSLRADPSFSNILVEKRWKSGARTSSYRQPDIQAHFGPTRMAFEVQLSTTFLSVVVGRREFYRGENAMLIWALRRFNAEDRRLTIDDLLFNNNSNILVVDDETVASSEEQGAFIARCWYREPYLTDGRIDHRWSNKLVKVREMSFNVEEQLAFSFDVQGRKIELNKELAQLAEAKRQAALDAARAAFFRFCEGWTNDRDHLELEEEFDDAVQPLIDLGVPMPRTLGEASLLHRYVTALRSIEVGYPAGFRFDKLVQVLHTMAESYTGFIYFIGHALNIYDRHGLIERQDPHGRWAARREMIKAEMKAGDPRYEPTMEWAVVLPILFPALAGIPKWAEASVRRHPGTEARL